MKNKSLTIFGIGFIVVFGGFIIYLYTLGMFGDVAVVEKTSEVHIIYGKKFEGDMGSKAAQSVFMEVGKMHEEGTIKGSLCGWYLSDPQANVENTVAILGIMVTDSNAALLEGFKYYKVPSKKVLHAYIHADYKVAPTRTYSAITKYSEEKKIKLQQEYFEWFTSKDDAYVEVGIEE